MFWSMQGVALFGLALSMTSLLKCAAELTGSEYANKFQSAVDRDPNIYSLDIIKGLTSILDISSSHPLEKPYEEILDGILKNSIKVEKGPFYPKSKKSNIDLKNDTTERNLRHKRAAGFLNIPIPTLLPIYKGLDEKSDFCERDEVMSYDGDCHQILSQGPCQDNEIILVDYQTKKGYCGPRLCNPDRVFVFGDQRCHDPLESDICPPGRILFTTSYGTPVCGCPYGTYEEEDDVDEDVCKPVLSKKEEDDCPRGQVFWFRNFKSEPECVPDPCNGLNTNRSIDELPFIPSNFDGKCYQLGEELVQCPDDTFYTLSYQNLGGICASIEEAGYTVLDDDMLEEYARLFGSRLPRDLIRKIIPLRPNFGLPSSSRFNSVSNSIVPFRIGQSVTGNRISRKSRGKNTDVLLTPTHRTAFSPAAISLEGHTDMAKFYRQYLGLDHSEEDTEEDVHSRRKRDDSDSSSQYKFSYASPANVYEPTIASCRAGSSIGTNYKCNLKYLPARPPVSRSKRNIRPISPFPSCPKGTGFSLRRRCISNFKKIQSPFLAAGLG